MPHILIVEDETIIRSALRRLLQKRFGPLSEDVLARLQSASIDELELWLDRALDADSLAGVFAQ